MAHVGKPFAEQYEGYLAELARGSQPIRSVWDLNALLKLSLSRDEFEGMAHNLKPSPAFVEAFGKLLLMRKIVNEAELGDFQAAASLVEQPEGIKSFFSIEQERRMARFDAKPQAAPVEQDPEAAMQFKDVLDQFYWNGDSLAALVDHVVQHPKMNGNRFARFRASLLDEDDINRKTVDTWKTETERSDRLSIRILRKAYGVGAREEAMMQEMATRAKPVVKAPTPLPAPEESAAPAPQAMSLGQIIDRSFEERHDWKQLIEQILHNHENNAEQFCAHMQQVVESKGLPKNYVLNGASFSQWLLHGTQPQSKTLHEFCTVFDMTVQHERKMAKLTQGRFLEKDELTKWIDVAEAALPKIKTSREALAALKAAGPDSLSTAAQITQAERDVVEAQKEVWGTLCTNLYGVSGIGEKRMAAFIETTQLEDWRAGLRRPYHASEAKSFIAVTLEAELAAGNPEATDENLNRLYRLISQRPMNVEQVLAENDTSRWKPGDLLNALVGEHGIVTRSNPEMSTLLGVSQSRYRQIKNGDFPTTQEQRGQVLELVQCTNPETVRQVHAIMDRLNTRPGPGGR